MLFMRGMVPMVGFGFVDNFIMLTAGDAIDVTFGSALQISTLAAAGLGNLVSDVAGLGLSSTIEVKSGASTASHSTPHSFFPPHSLFMSPSHLYAGRRRQPRLGCRALVCRRRRWS